MRSTSRRSASKPSQPDDVPLHPITSTLASASNSAAARILLSSNCPSACADSPISVTLKREKCALHPGMTAASALIKGSSAVFEEGVSTPSRRVEGMRVLFANWRLPMIRHDRADCQQWCKH
jgi:hypothetical protein